MSQILRWLMTPSSAATLRGVGPREQVIDRHARAVEQRAVRLRDGADQDAEVRSAVAEGDVESLERAAAALAARAVKVPAPVFELHRVAVGEEIRMRPAGVVHFEFREPVALARDDEIAVVYESRRDLREPRREVFVRGEVLRLAAQFGERGHRRSNGVGSYFSSLRLNSPEPAR